MVVRPHSAFAVEEMQLDCMVDEVNETDASRAVLNRGSSVLSGALNDTSQSFAGQRNRRVCVTNDIEIVHALTHERRHGEVFVLLRNESAVDPDMEQDDANSRA